MESSKVQKVHSLRKPIPAPLVFEDKLYGRNILFNPFGGKITIVTPRVHKIYKLFDGSKSIEEIYKRQNTFTKPEILQIVKKLVDEKLLLIAGYQPPIRKRPSGSHQLRIWVHVTNACNLACRYCYIRKNNESMKLSVAREMIRAIRHTLSLHPYFKEIFYVLSGGEPLTNLSTVEEIFRYSEEIGKRLRVKRAVGLITNGTLVNRQIISLIKKNDVKISVSLDSIGKNTDRVFKNGQPSSGVVLRNIDTLMSHGIIPYILITVTQENLDHLLELTDYLLRKGLSFRYALMRDLHGGDYIKEEFHSKLISVLHDCYDLMERAWLRGDRSFLKYPTTLETISFKYPRSRSCGIGKTSLCVSYDGKIYLCQSDINFRPPVGSIGDKDILDTLWKQKVFPDLEFYPNIQKYNSCSRCRWRFYCAGGCPLLTKLATGRLNTKSPYCRVFKEIIPRIIRIKALALLEGRRTESA